jgi:ATP-dependent Clp protease ATP-binding subunit ClpC
MDNIFDQRFTTNAKNTLKKAQIIAAERHCKFIGTEHILLGMLTERKSQGADILLAAGITVQNLMLVMDFSTSVEEDSGELQTGLTNHAQEAIKYAIYLAKEYSQPYVATEHLLLGILMQHGSGAEALLRQVKVNPDQVRSQIEAYLAGAEEQREPGESSEEAPVRPRRTARTPSLDSFSVDLTAQAKAGKLDPVIGREKEISRLVSILNRRTKNNPILIGEPGVGKTAIVEGLAQRIIAENVPENLVGKRLMQLDLASVVAGTKYRGEFEERLKKIISEVKEAGNVVLFIDEIHMIMGAGAAEGALDAANILKPSLARGEMRAIGATTLEEHRRYIEKDTALERRFQPVVVQEATQEEAVEVLKGIRKSYEEYHQVKISDEALLAAAKLSHRYLPDRHLPDKAIDLIDEAASVARIRNNSSSRHVQKIKRQMEKAAQLKERYVDQQEYEKAQRVKFKEDELERKLAEAMESVDTIEISHNDVAEVISTMTGIPLSRLVQTEVEKLLGLEKAISRQIVGQTEAIEAVARSIRRGRTGVADERRPIGSFIFLGPTGVGKTELAKVLAKEIFEHADALIKVDMSEFMERHTVARLVGAPAGYVGYDDGGQLTELVRRNPHSVILLDEIEKAHSDVFNMLLQILEDGQLTDAKGRKVDFRNTIIIMTSNTGAGQIFDEAVIGFNTSPSKQLAEIEKVHEENTDKVMAELRRQFRPEFLNRIDRVIVFRPLAQMDIKEIVNLQLNRLGLRLAERQIRLKVTDGAKKLLVEKGHDVKNGARPLKRVIQQLIEDPLAEALLSGSFREGDTVTITRKGENLNLLLPQLAHR